MDRLLHIYTRARAHQKNVHSHLRGVAARARKLRLFALFVFVVVVVVGSMQTFIVFALVFGESDDDDENENDDDAIGFNHARTPRTSDIDGAQVFVRSFLPR